MQLQIPAFGTCLGHKLPQPDALYSWTPRKIMEHLGTMAVSASGAWGLTEKHVASMQSEGGVTVAVTPIARMKKGLSVSGKTDDFTAYFNSITKAVGELTGVQRLAVVDPRVNSKYREKVARDVGITINGQISQCLGEDGVFSLFKELCPMLAPYYGQRYPAGCIRAPPGETIEDGALASTLFGGLPSFNPSDLHGTQLHLDRLNGLLPPKQATGTLVCLCVCLCEDCGAHDSVNACAADDPGTMPCSVTGLRLTGINKWLLCSPRAMFFVRHFFKSALEKGSCMCGYTHEAHSKPKPAILVDRTLEQLLQASNALCEKSGQLKGMQAQLDCSTLYLKAGDWYYLPALHYHQVTPLQLCACNLPACMCCGCVHLVSDLL